MELPEIGINASDILEVVSSDTLQCFLKRQWKLHQASPLFRASPENVKSHIRALNEEINSNWIKGERLTYKIHLEYCSTLRAMDNAPEPLKVEVTCNDVVVYVGYFLNWCPVTLEDNTFRKLPLLLVRSRKAMCSIVHRALRKVFDCTIMKMPLTEEMLVTLFCVLLQFYDCDEKRFAKLKYLIPGHPHQNSISTSIQVKGAALAFNFFNRPELGPVEDVQLGFYEKIKSHFRGIYSLDFSYAKMIAVTMPNGSFHESGQMILRRLDVIAPVLIALQGIVGNEVPAAPASVITSIHS